MVWLLANSLICPIYLLVPKPSPLLSKFVSKPDIDVGLFWASFIKSIDCWNLLKPKVWLSLNSLNCPTNLLVPNPPPLLSKSIVNPSILFVKKSTGVGKRVSKFKSVGALAILPSGWEVVFPTFWLNTLLRFSKPNKFLLS